MKTLGIIGGIGPESTIAYYRAILNAYRDRHIEAPAPSVLIDSIDIAKLLRLVGAGQLEQLTAYLADELARLAAGGASLGILAANTPHIVFDDLQQRSPIPLLSIVDAACEEAGARKLLRLGLLGTRFTMQGRFYPEVFSRRGLTIVTPPEEDQNYIHAKYTTELLQNIFLPQTRDGLSEVIERLQRREGIDGVILGGTELPLILPEGTVAGVPLLDTTQIHAAATVARLWP